MSRPTITLAMILKNEAKNINRLLDSVEGCFDEIVIADTGSTDNTKELALARGCKVYDFKWINDFSAARNFAFSKATQDYICWLDGDDVLHNKDGFIRYRDHALEFNDVAYATYNYALDSNGKPIISFVRERIFKRSLNPKWNYRLHEGIMIKREWTTDYAVSWAVNHLRDAEDMAQDKSRNIKILEEIKESGEMDARLMFYYGKELYEGSQASKALVAFEEATKNSDLESHDRILTYQYASYAAMQCADQIRDEFKDQKHEYLHKALNYAHKGMELDPNRAEFHVICGDVHLKMMDMNKAIPYYSAAKKCSNPSRQGSPYEGAIYSFVDCYGENPTMQLAKIYFNQGRLKESRKEALEAKRRFNNQEAISILQQLESISRLTKLDNNQTATEEIVITTPPMTAYPFDEKIYQEKGTGGSETACIEMAMNLRKLTGREVKVFMMREDDFIGESGVQYLSNKNVNQYFSEYKPKVHIAWRHNIKVTNATTYLWCHDLLTPTCESVHNFDKMLCLTPWHKEYVMAKQNVPSDKIIVTRNGITPSKFHFKRKDKNPHKSVYMSSPDRGLDAAILVADKVRETYPDFGLEIYYGLENLYKYGLGSLGDKIKGMIAERPWIKYHGFTEQKKMYREVSDAAIWLHPASFIETSCITAMEMMALGIYPVTRSLGALKDTLKIPAENGQAILLDHACNTQNEINGYAEAVKSALQMKSWDYMEYDINAHSWETIAKEWVEFMNLEGDCRIAVA